MSPLSPRFCSLAALWSRSLTLGTLGLLFCVLGVATPSKSVETKPAWFTTPGHLGALVIDVPADWQYKSRSRGGAPTTVTMRTDDSVLHFTLLWNATDSPDFNSAEQQMKMLKETSVEYVLDKTEGGCVDLEFESLTGSEVEGLYTVLLKTKGPNEFRTLTPGIFSVGEFQVFFTMLSKETETAARLLALEMFRGSRFEADASSRVRNTQSVPATIEGAPSDSSPDSDEHGSEGHQH